MIIKILYKKSFQFVRSSNNITDLWLADPARDPGAGAAQEAGGQAGRHSGPAHTEPHHAARGGEDYITIKGVLNQLFPAPQTIEAASPADSVLGEHSAPGSAAEACSQGGVSGVQQHQDIVALSVMMNAK